MDCATQAGASSVPMKVANDYFDALNWIEGLQESVVEAIVSCMWDEGKAHHTTTTTVASLWDCTHPPFQLLVAVPALHERKGGRSGCISLLDAPILCSVWLTRVTTPCTCRLVLQVPPSSSIVTTRSTCCRVARMHRQAVGSSVAVLTAHGLLVNEYECEIVETQKKYAGYPDVDYPPPRPNRPTPQHPPSYMPPAAAFTFWNACFRA